MSDIPKSDRSQSRLRAQDKAYDIRKRIMAELMASFAYSQKKQEKHIRAVTAHIKDQETKEATAAKIRELEEDFDSWFIKRERDKVADLCEGIARHDKCLEVMDGFLDRSRLAPDEVMVAKRLLRKILKTFELDVSRLSDQEVAELYKSKIDPMMNVGVDPRLLTGEKMLRKGVDIGSQPSQDIGIIYPYRIDNYAKIVKSVKGYGRYTDDFHAIHPDRAYLEELLDGFRHIAAENGLIINEKKTRICRISEPFRILKVLYWLTDTGKVVRKIHPKSITRERRKLKAYKRLLDAGRIDYETVENSFKSWLGGNWKLMSKQQITNTYALYYALFQRRITWKKGHGRLLWLMGQPWKGSASMATTTSATTLSVRRTLLESSSM